MEYISLTSSLIVALTFTFILILVVCFGALRARSTPVIIDIAHQQLPTPQSSTLTQSLHTFNIHNTIQQIPSHTYKSNSSSNSITSTRVLNGLEMNCLRDSSSSLSSSLSLSPIQFNDICIVKSLINLTHSLILIDYVTFWIQWLDIHIHI